MRVSTTTALALGALTALIGARAEQPAAPAGEAVPFSISGPYTEGNLSIFLFHGKDTLPSKPILTLQEALEQKKIVVHETSSVNELSIENVSPDTAVFVQAGDIVKGGRQDRVLGYDLIVSAKSKVPIPSFCVEQGRWSNRGREDATKFDSSNAQVQGKDLKLAINQMRRQDVVWAKCREAQGKLSMNVGKEVQNKQSPTSLQLTLEDKELLGAVEKYVKALTKSLEGKDDVIGLAVAINGKVEGADVYGSAALFRKLWPKLLNASAIDALAELQKDKKFAPASADTVKAFLTEVEKGKRVEQPIQSAGGYRQASGQQQAVQSNARDSNRQVQQATPTVKSDVKYRVQVFTQETEKNFLMECRDREQKDAIVHRSYIAK